jgi:hypothetical protein
MTAGLPALPALPAGADRTWLPPVRMKLQRINANSALIRLTVTESYGGQTGEGVG